MGSGWLCKPVLVFSSSIDQAEQYLVCYVAHDLMDGKFLLKMKEINPSKYRFLKNMLKSLKKLANSKVSIHEIRKTLQKS